MNVYINYQFNFGNNIGVSERENTSAEIEVLTKALVQFINQISASRLKNTVFKLLMEYMMKHGEPSKKELKEVYDLLEFLKVISNFQNEKLIEIDETGDL